jgi:hypothetical protein
VEEAFLAAVVMWYKVCWAYRIGVSGGIEGGKVMEGVRPEA